jgi:hypothetical protein
MALPQTVSTVGKGAFANCGNLASIDLSKTAITTIADNLCLNCTSLTDIKLPEDTGFAIDNYAFQNCSKIEELDLSKLSINSIGKEAFVKCSAMKTIKFPTNIGSIG